MSQKPVVIPKQPVLKPAEDFYGLRREGIGFIEQMGSRLWTDYNVHDPGITILEALCYALTDLAYRIGWDIKDILTLIPPPSGTDPLSPFPDQAFFTAREILSVNPCTPDDFRRLLIDLDLVRNAWVSPKDCACDLSYYAWCEKDALNLSYQPPTDPQLQAKKVAPLGLYEILLELEADPNLGDLNDRKIEHTYTTFDADGHMHSVTLELRFPKWERQNWEAWKIFLTNKDAFLNENGPSFGLTLTKFGRSKTDPASLVDGSDDGILRSNWRTSFYASFDIEPVPGKIITIENVVLRIFGDTTAKGQATVAGFKEILRDTSANGPIARYCRKVFKVEDSIEEAQETLHRHRNLDEDYCRIKGVEVEDVAVCADVEVAPDADIERVQAKIWFEIAQYFNPPVPFYTLQELVDAGVAVEDIFNGPALSNGFIKTEELEAAGLKTVLRTSDIINRLTDIDGVVAVNQLQLSKYDAEGNVVKGAADPTLQSNGTWVFDGQKTSASWLLFVSANHQPRLYFNQSRFLFYKNGLPFLPRMDEAYDTLTQLRGEAERPKIKDTPNDLLVPSGTFRSPEDYFPVQYSLPQTYGIGPEGLPSQASALRRAQAKQLKAYLMVFEQLLGNSLAQVAHSANLFSLNPDINRTYFNRVFAEKDIQGYDDIINGLSPSVLESLTEKTDEFEERRNRFLNHLMARFGEQFGEYALMLTNFQGQDVAEKRLIDDKISFLKAYPSLSRDRAKAFNFQLNPTDPTNVSGLKRRVSLLLGYPDLTFSWTINGTSPGPYTITHYQLKDTNGKSWLEGDLAITEADEATAQQKAFQEITVQMIQADAYDIVPDTDQFLLKLKDKINNPLGQYPVPFETKASALASEQELLAWSSNERAIVVEHLLLRPKFPGDALYPACTDGDCGTCGDEDPYSFRLTYVMPGWTAPFNENLDMRRFADRTIQQETPSHLLGKICWVGNDGFIENPCDPVIAELAKRLEAKGQTAEGVPPTDQEACDCALAIYSAYSTAFKLWYDGKLLDYLQPDFLKAALITEFTTNVNPADLSCTTILDPIWADILDIMVDHFQQVALSGWQFERFETAWKAWLTANAAIDWTKEQLKEQIEAILASNVTSTISKIEQPGKLCDCAGSILTAYGTDFYTWIGNSIKAGISLSALDFSTFIPNPIVLCPDLNIKSTTDTIAALTALLNDRYSAYKDVSYRLWIVVNLLSKLRNTYPGATLHDCDDGSDQNPVRLGSTALGNYPLRATIAPANAIVPEERSISVEDVPKAGKARTGKSRKPNKPSSNS